MSFIGIPKELLLKIIVSKYKWARDAMRTFQTNHSSVPLLTNLTIMSASWGVPLLALYYMAQKEYGPSEELTKAIKSVIDFYGYTIIEGIDEV